MYPLKYSTTVICALFITIGAASVEEEKVYGEVNRTVSFGATSLNASVSSIIWKQINGASVVKAIEWDVEDDGVSAPNLRFKDITYLDYTTGQITINKLTVEHSGLYTIDINSKEQEQRFNLEVLPPVPKPVIKIEKIKVIPDAVYLICKYNETIIWKNSTGGTLQGSPHYPNGEFIIVEKEGNPDFFYTCTLENAVSEKTSDPVYERDLFEDEDKQLEEGEAKQNDTQLEKGAAKRNDGGSLWIVSVKILILILAPIIVFVIMYKFWPTFHKIVHDNLKDKPCIGAILKRLDGKNKDYSLPPQLVIIAETNVNGDPQPDGEPNVQHLKEDGEDETEK
ncbi:uncharacterized protein LOC127948882 isoform X6 [Carassius gibelio]|uniref:uncharacterized protein LOC127948882 isoform X4 n=1 Tax=Carassius gibelio TaxID=101364 RepID=UPI002278E96E|nr:uncharacterized protein LOC127948882 isoform X4 [Carassius gibelio]XP_052401659.1 uncharacterized protein LOC127948882 isoform X6 [Carassius gibelio]